MRVIKFRAVCAISKEIVYGDLIHGVSYKKGNVYILPDTTNLAYVKHCDPLDGVRVLRETIGQFTGLTDKSGKDIFEGDIIRIRWIEMIYQTHTGDNIICGSYTEPDYIKIFEADYEVIFNDGVFCINTNDMEAPHAFGDPNNALTSFLFPWWEQMPDVDLSDISDDYFEDDGFETIKELSATLGCEIIGNTHQNPELLNTNQ